MELLDRITDYLIDNELKLATAESCTAGLIVSELARVAGSGQSIDCGLGVYSPQSKNRYLGVSFDTIERYGLTSEAVASEMAAGALANNDADVALANTGIAGPNPGDDDTPIGTVCFAWAFRHAGDHYDYCETRRFDGTRNEVRLAAAHYALERLPHYHGLCLDAASSGNDNQSSRHAEQRAIGSQLYARGTIDPGHEVERRRDFLCRAMAESGQQALVLGISGGVDSTVAGRLAQLAVEKRREQGEPATFIAMRLPYGEQQDADDADRALAFIEPDEVLDVNIQDASDSVLMALESGGMRFKDAHQRDFVLGNIKARQRMTAQYAVAGARSGLVIGTDQAAEALMGFFTKHGDGACDVAPLTGLTKQQVRRLGAQLDAPESLVHKAPTADLESLAPQKLDEEAMGVSYAEIDAFLEDREVSNQAFETIVRTYRATAHKRQLPRAPD
ncbi:ammonia-dependent NAD(+) synthetase [Billgrantia kenyensis]|uniref:NH(3)-dependent NAD(+) synthetase n=1 Tax=Billgrantia kenyensis TaxID=321266 RepID=A0A7V9W306_9GAMM|nr:ammonia-dependent NAD(+) synthetase [Halomonas kenyensis]MBA2780035.1 ammonia-dependent NAD(+) synthetase [Halomonas kenyensis]MCG6662950.1 ammonia-dependent NAD(+) synthetase [Halomonas kenyensis]